MVGDWHLAEDVVQAAVIGMYRHLHHIEQSYGPSAYARRAVVNAAMSELRRPFRPGPPQRVGRKGSSSAGVRPLTICSASSRPVAGPRVMPHIP